MQAAEPLWLIFYIIMKEKTFNKEKTTDQMAFELEDCKQKIRLTLDKYRDEVEKLMFEEFNAKFKNIKELYDLNVYVICITEVISLGKRLEWYFDEMKKIDTEILSLIDDETEEY